MSADTSIITAAYRAILSREPDPIGLDHHIRMLEEDPSGDSVIRSILNSVEYRDRFMPSRPLAIMPCYDFRVIAPSGEWMLSGLEHGDDYEPYVIESYREACRGKRVLDVGANIGIFSIVAAKVTTSEVCSVEVSQLNVKLIIANARLNNITNISVLPFAASDKLGVAKFYTTPDIIKVIANPLLDINNIPDVDVALSAPLDLMASDKFDVIKIDVEGPDHIAFRGGRLLS